MATKSIRIGPADNVVQYDDTEFASAIETSESITVGDLDLGTLPTAIPVDVDLSVFRDDSNSDAMTTCTMTELKAFLKTYFDTLYGSISSSGALVYLSADQSILDITETGVAFDAETYDDNTFHDNVTNNTRLTIPAGVSKIQLIAASSFAVNGTGIRELSIAKNGSKVWAGYYQSILSTLASNYVNQLIITPIINVIAGDYFECLVYQDSGAALALRGSASADTTWFSLEVKE